MSKNIVKNQVLAARVIEQILARPDLYDQTTFAEDHECGTAACIAGHALLLSGYTVDEVSTFRSPQGHQVDAAWAAGQLLGYSEDRFGFDYELFTGDPASYWPNPWNHRYAWAEKVGDRSKAEVAAAYLAHLAGLEGELA